MVPFNERVKNVFAALNTTPHKFAKEHTDFNSVSLFNLINPDRRPGLEMLERLCKAESRISAEYLLRGEGEPLRDKRRAVDLTTVEELTAFKTEMDELLDRRIEELRSKVGL